MKNLTLLKFFEMKKDKDPDNNYGLKKAEL